MLLLLAGATLCRGAVYARRVTSTVDRPQPEDTDSSGPGGSAVLRLLRTSAGIAIAMAVMNVGTYAFQMVAARLLGPSEYGAVAGMMALLMVLSVVQLGLQATAARRIAATPEDVAAIEQTILTTTWRAALVLGAVALLASPLVWWLLRLDGLLSAVLLGLCVVPVTVMGGQAGVLQGERRWLPLSLVYLSVGLPRVLIGGGALLVSATEASAMAGVLVASWIPVAIGSWTLRRRTHRAIVTEHDRDVRRDVRRETYSSSLALLAFVALSNLDVVVARNVLDDHQAGLYAGGLIVTKAVLFLPQFAVVILFPSMSTAGESRSAVMRGLAFLSGLGAACVAGTYLLSGLALVFIGGNDYEDVQSRLWLFAVLGGLLSVLQLLVYAGLAKRGRWTKYLVTLGVLALVGLGSLADSLTRLAVTVAVIDVVVVVLLVALQVFRGKKGTETLAAAG
ncbi:oligosaccharide flippase family protein [Nocardioides humilatus]|uniref:Oligosaccharide flippase family protein n=1 Tax=Nocardioides humilatus TaxID=2607660 RepID=A0A5B1LB21_9ACTN|nr:oligosaccharide flippase family protein [Nocardioides humilatus]